jgi:hypothetical protein
VNSSPKEAFRSLEPTQLPFKGTGVISSWKNWLGHDDDHHFPSSKMTEENHNKPTSG